MRATFIREWLSKSPVKQRSNAAPACFVRARDRGRSVAPTRMRLLRCKMSRAIRRLHALRDRGGLCARARARVRRSGPNTPPARRGRHAPALPADGRKPPENGVVAQRNRAGGRCGPRQGSDRVHPKVGCMFVASVRTRMRLSMPIAVSGSSCSYAWRPYARAAISRAARWVAVSGRGFSGTPARTRQVNEKTSRAAIAAASRATLYMTCGA